MRQRSHIEEVQEGPTDAVLTSRAAAGEVPAFEELYRRHVDAAWRVAQAVTGNPHDAADAVSDAFTRVFQALPSRLRDGDHFRPYLLAAARNAAIDVLRRSGRLSPTDMEEMDSPAIGNEPGEMLMGDVDAALVSRAFHSLPERWRSVLWLTEVEGIPPREAAELLGLSANAVAQLAVRARAGLRERFLQAHLGTADVLAPCRYTVEHLGAYVAGGLAPRDIAKVDQHLAGCAPCTGRLAELEEIGPALLRRAALPMPLGLATLVVGKWHLASTATSGVAGAGVGAGAGAATGAATGATAVATPAAVGAGGLVAAGTAPLAASVASLALFVASVVGVGVIAPGASRPPAAPPPVVVAAAGDATEAAGATEVAAAAGAGAAESAAAVVSDDPVAGLVAEEDRSITTDVPLGPDPLAVPVPGAETLVPTPEQVTQLAVDLGLVDLVLGLGAAGCTGIRVAGVTIGCEQAPSDQPAGVTISTGGLLPEVDLQLPEAPLPSALPLAPLPVINELLGVLAGTDKAPATTAPAPTKGRLLRDRLLHRFAR